MTSRMPVNHSPRLTYINTVRFFILVCLFTCNIAFQSNEIENEFFGGDHHTGSHRHSSSKSNHRHRIRLSETTIGDSPLQKGDSASTPPWRATKLEWELATAIERILDFFSDYTDDLLVDVLMGIRASIDQLHVAEENLVGEDERFSTFVQNLAEKGEAVLEKAIPSTREKFSDFKVIGKLLYMNFDWPRHPRVFPGRPHLRDPTETNEKCSPPFFNEVKSDACLSGLLHGISFSSSQNTSCEAENRCARVLTHSCHGYTLTHQLLYLMVGIKCGCVDQIQEKLSEIPTPFGETPRVDELIDAFCYNIYRESISISLRDFPLSERDLFIEQGVLCGLMNYVDFFRPDWVRTVLSWLQPEGCIRDDSVLAFRHHETKTDPEQEGVRHREKRRDSILHGDCSSHTTSVAIGYYSTWLRHLTSLNQRERELNPRAANEMTMN